MLIVWLICAFGLLSQSTMINANSTSAAIKAASTSSIDATESNESGLDLEKAETKDSKKLEIIKQIRKVNNDGSYTVGYEAVDGTFKIESRDVLGNIKGTYGYVDANGEIKRVSYTANNTTNGLKSTPPTIVEDVVHIPRQNKTVSTTRRPPALAYLMSSTSSPAKANSMVIQAIPKRRILLASANKHQIPLTTRKISETTTATSIQKSEPTTTVIYATSIRSTVNPSSTISTVEQLSKPDKIEINDRFSKVLNMNKESKLHSENDENERKTEPRKRGNTLRRQLPSDQTETFEAQQQQVYSHASDEETVHTYSGVTGTQRPVFTTTSSPRIPALVLAARSRAALLKNAGLHSSQTSSTTERVYSKPPRRKPERRDENEPSTEPSSENEYLTQSPVAVQIPANQDSTHSNNHEQNIYHHPNAYLPRAREYLRQSPSSGAIENNNDNNNNSPRQFKLPVQFVQSEIDNEQYLRETTDATGKSSTTSTIAPDPYTTNDLNAATQPILQSYHPRQQRLYEPQRANDYDQRLQQSIPLPIQPYQAPYYNQHPDRPLTARDFERLLNLLVVRHQQYQRINILPGLMNQNFYGGFGNNFNGYGYNGYNPYLYNPYQQIPRPPLYNQFDPRYTAFSRSLPPVPPPNSFFGPYSEQENMYQAQSPVEQQLPFMNQQQRAPTKQRRQHFNNNNQQFYGTNFNNQLDASSQLPSQDSVEYLPQNVREELLYRMLMLAIQPESAPLPIPDASTMHEYIKTNVAASTTTVSPNSKKPVRSVQILGEE